jgi:hypothetical protein
VTLERHKRAGMHRQFFTFLSWKCSCTNHS